MEAPKKIYICPSDLAGIDYEEEWLEFPWGDNNIEYTRTDAFIEKAWDWLSNHVNDYIINDKYILPNGKMSRDWLKVKSDMFEDFKKYMKGE